MSARRAFSGPVNLGNPSEFRILELAQKIVKMTGSPSRLVYKPLPQADPKQRKPDITLAKARLSWKPRVPLRPGLLKTIDYFKSLKKYV